jgi:hypothetical protein
MNGCDVSSTQNTKDSEIRRSMHWKNDREEYKVADGREAIDSKGVH